MPRRRRRPDNHFDDRGRQADDVLDVRVQFVVQLRRQRLPLRVAERLRNRIKRRKVPGEQFDNVRIAVFR